MNQKKTMGVKQVVLMLSLIHIYVYKRQVMFLDRDDYYNKDTDTPNIAEVIIAKQRNGPIGTIQLMWRPELTKFANLAR